MTDQTITVVADYKIYLYLMLPLLREFLARGVRVDLWGYADALDLAARELGNHQGITPRDLRPLKRRHRLRWVVHRTLQEVVTPTEFSYQYQKKRSQASFRATGTKRILLELSRIVPKVRKSRVNRFLSAVTGFGMSNPFGSRKIVVSSLNGCQELLVARGQRIFTVMESWDHPVKVPNGYVSHRVYAWNRSLGQDWEETQGDGGWMPTYPLKLRYAIERVAKAGLWERRRNTARRPLCVYAVASTAKFSYGKIVGIESRLITQLCEATRLAGWDLHIKPRPNGLEGEFDAFTKQYGHVRVGTTQSDQGHDPANYYLDDEYNRCRFEECLDAMVVINAFTTFGLDAAAAGIPVLQLDMRDAQGFGDSRLVYGNNHIAKYLLGLPHVCRITGDSVPAQLANILCNGVPQAAPYRDELRRWLVPDQTCQQAVTRIVDDILSH